jgi:hypothetical protein
LQVCNYDPRQSEWYRVGRRYQPSSDWTFRLTPSYELGGGEHGSGIAAAHGMRSSNGTLTGVWGAGFLLSQLTLSLQGLQGSLNATTFLTDRAGILLASSNWPQPPVVASASLDSEVKIAATQVTDRSAHSFAKITPGVVRGGFGQAGSRVVGVSEPQALSSQLGMLAFYSVHRHMMYGDYDDAMDLAFAVVLVGVSLAGVVGIASVRVPWRLLSHHLYADGEEEEEEEETEEEEVACVRRLLACLEAKEWARDDEALAPDPNPNPNPTLTLTTLQWMANHVNPFVTLTLPPTQS